MLQAFIITLREGLEAFLIVAISLAYLRKSGRDDLVPAVHWGIGLSILISIGAAFLFRARPTRRCGKAAGSCRGHFRHLTHRPYGGTARRIRATLKGTFAFGAQARFRASLASCLHVADDLAGRYGDGAADRCCCSRSGGRCHRWSGDRHLMCRLCRLALVQCGHRVNLGLFFQVTAVFLLVFVVQLLIYGFHELTEANIFPSRSLALGHGTLRPDGYRALSAYFLAMLPLGWLVISTLMPRRVPSAGICEGRRLRQRRNLKIEVKTENSK